ARGQAPPAGTAGGATRPTLAFAGDLAGVEQVSWSESGRWLIGRGQRLVLIDPATLEERLSLPEPGRAAAAAFEPAGQRVAYAGQDRQLWLFDTLTATRVAEFVGHEAEVTALAFSRDGRWLAAGDAGGRVIVWSVASHQPLLRLPPHTSPVEDVAFSVDGKEVISRAASTVWRWQVPDGRFVRNLYLHDEQAERGQALGSDLAGGIFMRPKADGSVMLGSLDKPPRQSLLKPAQTGNESPDLTSAVVSGKVKVLVRSGNEVELWDAAAAKREASFLLRSERPRWLSLDASGHELASLDEHGLGAWSLASLSAWHRASVCGADVSPDGKRVATSGEDHQLLLWNRATGAQLARYDLGQDSACSLNFSPDGSVLIAPSHSTILVFDAASGKRLQRLDGVYRSPFRFVAGHELMVARAVAGSPTKRNEVAFFDLATGVLKRAFDPQGEPDEVALSPDGSKLATAEHKDVTVWDVTSGQPLKAFRIGAAVGFLAWSRAGVLVGSSGGQIVRWDPGSGAELGRVRPPSMDDDYPWLEVAPDGASVVYRGDGAVHVWDVASERDKSVVNGPTCDGDLGSDGKSLLLQCRDDSVRVVDAMPAAAGASAPTITLGPRVRRAPEVKLTGAAHVTFSPDGRRLLVAGEDGRLRGWALDSDELGGLGGSGSIDQLVFSPDGKQLATGVNWFEAAVKDATTFATLKKLDASSPPKAGERFRLVGSSVDGQSAPALAAFGRDGKSLVYAAHDQTVVWDLQSGQVTKRLPEEPAAISQDAAWLAFLAEKQQAAPVRGHRRRAQSQLLLRSLTGSRRTLALDIEVTGYNAQIAFSRDGKWVAVGSRDIEVREVATGAKRATLKPAWNDLLSLAFSPDATRVLALTKGKAVLFDAVTSKSLAELEFESTDPRSSVADRGAAGRVAFHPDGKLVALAGYRGVVLWLPGSGAAPLALRMFEELNAGLLQPAGDDSRLQLLGPDLAEARKLLRCRLGARSQPFASCAEALEARGLLAAMRAASPPAP
ncbi:MAG TPA: hypothetical protein VNG33_17695, partial [Polyangiaceae bacterium]|nr:hypothetical protein [Polyangiaceae bacterium]